MQFDNTSAADNVPAAERLLCFSLGESRNTNRVENIYWTWQDFVDSCRVPVVGTQTMAEYLRLPSATQLDLKDVGHFTSGHYAGSTRNKTNIESRDVLIIDGDHLPADGIKRILDDFSGLGMYELLITSTRKHRPEAPRIRLAIPFTRPVSDIEYRAIARKIASMIHTGTDKPSIEWWDDTGYEFTRLMFWPSVCKGSEPDFVFEHNQGEWLDPDSILAMYEDYTDVESWPVCARMKDKLHADRKKMGNPLEKPGVIGAFCRVYSIHQAMDKFIPGVYVPGAHANRMTYAAGSSSNGALIYDNGLALFSRHETDPCYYQSLNAFDMCRIHLFGELDKDAGKETKVTELPSYKAMRDVAYADPEVKADCDAAKLVDMSGEFDDFDVEESNALQVLQEPTLAVSGQLYPNTEDGIALAFAEGHKGRLKFDHKAGAWFVWTGDRWKRDEVRLAFHWTRKLLRVFAGKTEDAKTLSKTSTASAVETAAKSDPRLAVTPNRWDADPWKLCVPGGFIDLLTGEMHPPDPTLMMSKQTRVAPAPPGTPAPIFLRFLDEATRGDVELQRFLQQLAGYALTGDVSKEKLFFVYGPGGNGKGVFINAIGNVLADYAVSANADVFTEEGAGGHPTELARMQGARLVTATETERERHWAESRIKELTGNERPITARYLHKDFFEFWPQFKIVFLGNYKPALRAVTPAIVRRLHIIPFEHKPVRVDESLKERLQGEYGI